MLAELIWQAQKRAFKAAKMDENSVIIPVDGGHFQMRVSKRPEEEHITAGSIDGDWFQYVAIRFLDITEEAMKRGLIPYVTVDYFQLMEVLKRAAEEHKSSLIGDVVLKTEADEGLICEFNLLASFAEQYHVILSFSRSDMHFRIPSHFERQR